MLDRLTHAEAMTAEDYKGLLKERAAARALYAGLAADCDGCVTLSAPSAAPVGLHSTGDASFAVPFSLLGVPAISLPVLQDEGLPLGLQITGFEHGDAATFAAAAAVFALFESRDA
jgi:Asp-tRNA(Asn)/Glu-tRNA(Gln) amidotransferase A subunit family amidase